MNPRILALSSLLLLPLARAAETAAEDLLRQGLFEEEANRDLAKAAERYRAVIAGHDRQRAFAATATFRLGEIARKQDDKAAAAAAFRTVVERFPEQAELARMSRENLAALGMAAAPVATAPAETRPVDPEDQEIEHLKKLSAASPDLLDGATETGWRPLHLAAANGQLKVLEFLLANRADPNGRTVSEQFTPLHLAAIHGRLAVLKKLIATQADVNATVGLSPESIKKLPPMEQRAAEPAGKLSALDLAILYDRREVARTLIQAGVDLKRRGPRLGRESSLTPLMVAIYLKRADLAAALIEAGGRESLNPEKGRGPLDLAVEAMPELVPALLKAGADPNPTAAGDFIPLQTAAGRWRIEAAKLLLDAGADPKAANTKGQTALHLTGQPEMMDLLVSRGADPNAKDAEGVTPLEVAVKAETPAWFTALLDRGAVADSESLLAKSSPAVLPLLRERLVYPKEYRPDAVLLSAQVASPRNSSDTVAGIGPVEIRPAPGSPPPSVVEALVGFADNWQALKELRIVRRDGDGKFKVEFAWTVGPDGSIPKDFPALQWGDILEVARSYGAQASEAAELSRRLSNSAVTLRLEGLESVRTLGPETGVWLGVRPTWLDDLGNRAMNGGPAGTPRQPRRVIRPGEDSYPGIGRLPGWVDPAKLKVTRKGVERPIELDLSGENPPLFRFVDGDIVEGRVRAVLQEELVQKKQCLLVTADFRSFRETDAPKQGLFRTLYGYWQQGNPIDLSRVTVIRHGDIAKREEIRLDELLASGDSGPSDRELRKKADALLPGDWIVVSPLPSGSEVNMKMVPLLQSAMSLPVLQRGVVVPPPVPKEQ